MAPFLIVPFAFVLGCAAICRIRHFGRHMGDVLLLLFSQFAG